MDQFCIKVHTETTAAHQAARLALHLTFGSPEAPQHLSRSNFHGIQLRLLNRLAAVEFCRAFYHNIKHPMLVLVAAH